MLEDTGFALGFPLLAAVPSNALVALRVVTRLVPILNGEEVEDIRFRAAWLAALGWCVEGDGRVGVG